METGGLIASGFFFALKMKIEFNQQKSEGFLLYSEF